MEKKVSCNFIGSLENENTACVAVTGCPGEEMAFTIKSKHSENIGYILHQDGQLELVESAFKDSRVTSGTKRVGGGPGGFHSDGDDEMINDEEIAEEMKFEKLCAAGDCSSMPAKQKMQIKIHYDSTFNADTSDVTTYLDQMVTHVQAHFCQISLGTQIAVEAIGGYTYHADQTWKAEPNFGSLDTPIKNIAAADTSGADLGVFMCKDSAFYGVVGLAWVGTMCKGWAGYNAGVNEKRGNVLATSEVVAHEMGHNMGMLHDFDSSHGGEDGACNGKGIMSYGSAPNVWSTCSKNDFLALYNSIISSSSKYWCLDVDATACGGAGPTTQAPTTQAPTTVAPTTVAPTTITPNSGCANMPAYMLNSDRIVGGVDAPTPIPWQVSVRSGTFAFCGATIIDASTVLCAAHCFYQSSASGKSIRAGSTQKSSGGQIRNIASLVWNTNSGFTYNPSTLDNDFVILKLDSPLELNADVQPACLPSSAAYLGVSSTEERCFTSGWGTLSAGGSTPETLKYVRVPAITNTACNNDYGGSITDSMICAGYPGVGGKDACQGDSGGPFVCNDGGKAVIAGVVSWGNGCALATHPGVYARTTYVLDWIKSQMSGGTPPGPTTAPPPTNAPPPTTAAPPPPTGCGTPSWANDKWCDDENNNADCNWDGGACCFNEAQGWDDYCEDCKCKECTPAGWHGDNYCDDNLNTDNCKWDGGDCCGDVNTNYCNDCTCLDPAFSTTTTTTTTTTTPPPMTGCGTPHWAKDQWCDDENNNADCNWDDGACCFNDYSGYDNYCNDCECLECTPSGWHGDTYCDDSLNTKNCKYDGGDCCGDNVITSYCKDCECLDPKN